MTGAPVVKRLDARTLKAAGIHPLETVLRDLAALQPGEVYELTTPHSPGKILDQLDARLLRWETTEQGPEAFVTTFTRQP